MDSPEPNTSSIDAISPSQIHRVLLEGAVQPVRSTPSFSEFEESLNFRRPMAYYGCNPLESVGANSGLLVTCIVQSAYRDTLCSAMQEHLSLDPAKSLLTSLHDKIRSLIPNNVRLHDQLNDHIRERKRKGVLIRIITAAQALEQLESEARAETTNAWIRQAERFVDEGLDSSMTDMSEKSYSLEISNSYLITSILYLLFKAELCEQDKQDFYLTLHSRFILANGVELERRHFVKEFGELVVESAPNTMAWIKSVIERLSPQVVATLGDSRDARHDLVYNGWTNDLLFAEGEVILPEVFMHDLNGLKGIREVTRIAVAGSALALHACTAAGVPTSALERPDDGEVYFSRASMVLAMNERHGKSQVDYEAVVAGHVVALATSWNPDISADAVDILRNQTVKVLRGEDAVIKVLEGRVKKAFGEIVSKESNRAQIPTTMKLDAAHGSFDVSLHTAKSRRLVQTVFAKYGMVFYASDLALAASKAFKIVDLAWRVYGNVLLEPMIQQLLDESA
jgi:hypothetical protein